MQEIKALSLNEDFSAQTVLKKGQPDSRYVIILNPDGLMDRIANFIKNLYATFLGYKKITLREFNSELAGFTNPAKGLSVAIPQAQATIEIATPPSCQVRNTMTQDFSSELAKVGKRPLSSSVRPLAKTPSVAASSESIKKNLSELIKAYDSEFKALQEANSPKFQGYLESNSIFDRLKDYKNKDGDFLDTDISSLRAIVDSIAGDVFTFSVATRAIAIQIQIQLKATPQPIFNFFIKHLV